MTLQDTTPLGLIPLIDLALERKRKVWHFCIVYKWIMAIAYIQNSFEVINKRTSLIKVKKPGKKHVQSKHGITIANMYAHVIKQMIKLAIGNLKRIAS